MQVAVDPRVELLSILYSLAGRPEYAATGSPAGSLKRLFGRESELRARQRRYLEDVKAHFGSYREHDAVARSSALARAPGISYNAPVGLAVYLDSIGSLEPLRPLSPVPEGLDPRWEGVAIDDYLASVRKFSMDSAAAQFMEEHRSLFGEIEAEYRQRLADQPVISWFNGFFGELADTQYVLVPGLMTGPNNYAAAARQPDGTMTFYQVVGVQDDVFSFTQLVVHELAHSYVNPIVDRHAQRIDAPAARLHKNVAAAMERQAYSSPRIMIYEYCVRAATIRYVDEHLGRDRAEQLSAYDRANGFVHIDGLVALYAEFQANRDDHTDFADFFPRVVEFFEDVVSEEVGGAPASTR